MKSLIATALLQFPPQCSGAIVDDGHGRAALRRLTGTGRWIARPVELPGSRPLAFEGEEEVAIRLRSWPTEHVVKCLIFYHAGDLEALRAAQEAKLLELQRACRATGHRLLVEVIPPDWESDPARVAAALARLYEIGLLPDWWKLPPLACAAAWQEIARTVAAGDAQCRGTLVLGLDQSMEQLSAAFERAKASRAATGFAIGRSVFRIPAENWLRGAIGDAAFVDDVAARFEAVLQAWETSVS
jgi:5-dehydro-2-deoxygluconokinase